MGLRAGKAGGAPTIFGVHHVMLEDQFWDQDGVMVKSLKTLNIALMSGRMVAQRQRMGS